MSLATLHPKKDKGDLKYDYYNIWEEDELCDKISKILTDYYEDDREIQAEIQNKFNSNKSIFQNILNKETTRSDIRGFISKMLIENHENKSNLDDLIQKLFLYGSPSINFGILFGLEEISDYIRIKNYFAYATSEKLRARAIDILNKPKYNTLNLNLSNKSIAPIQTFNTLPIFVIR